MQSAAVSRALKKIISPVSGSREFGKIISLLNEHKSYKIRMLETV